MRLMIRLLVLALLFSIFMPVNSNVAVASMTTKTIVVKGSDGQPYQGALVKGHWYSEDKAEESSEILTTDSSGAVSLTYDSSSNYSFVVIQPPVTDTTHAIGRLNNIQTFASSNIEFILKKADFRLIIKKSDNSDAPAGSGISLMKFSVETLRTGTFGVSGDDVQSFLKENLIYAYPASSLADQFSIYRYYSRTKTETGWDFKIFENSALTEEVAPVAGAYVFKLISNNVQLNLKDSFGQPISIPVDKYIGMFANRIRPDSGPNSGYSFYDEVDGIVSSTGVWKGRFKTEGEYRLIINSFGSHLFPSMMGPTIWVDSQGKVSSTSSSLGFEDSLNLDFTIPSPALKLEFSDSEDNNSLISFSAQIEKKSGSTYVREPGTSLSNIYSSDGKASAILPDGDYRFLFYADQRNRPETTFFVNIAAQNISLTDKSGNPINPISGIYKLATQPSLIKFRLIDGANPIPNGYLELTNRTLNSVTSIGADSNGYVFTNLTDATYDLVANPTGQEDPIKAEAYYVLKVQNGVVDSLVSNASNTEIIAANGVYPVGLSEPNLEIQLKIEGSTPSPTWPFYGTLAFLNANNEPNLYRNLRMNSALKSGTNVTSGNYRIKFQDNRAGNLLGVSNLCAVTGAGKTQCIVDYPAVNFTFTTSDQNGNLLKSDYSAQLRRIDGTTIFQEAGYASPSWENGKIQSRIFDGDYQLNLIPSSINSSIGASKTYRFTISGGAVTRVFDPISNLDVTPNSGIYEFSLQSTNFRAQVKGGGSVLMNASINSYKKGGGSEQYSYGTTDSSGNFSFYLQDGEHYLTVRPPYDAMTAFVPTLYKVKVQNSNIVLTEKEDGTVVVPVEGIYVLDLDSPNVTGKILISDFANSDNYNGFLNAYRLSADGFHFEGVTNSQVETDGDFALKLSAGDYVLSYYNYSTGAGVVSDFCTVPASGSKVCNLNFPATNLRFNVSNGATNINGTVYASLERQFNSGQARIGASLTSPRDNLSFRANLLDGQYRLYLNPNQELQGDFSQAIYTFDVSNGAVTNLRNHLNQTITATDNVFSLSLRTPTIKGTVVIDDGTTPYPESQINVTRENTGWGFGSDTLGRFAIQLDEDGVYVLRADPRYGDAQWANSVTQSVTVTNGQGSSNVVLRLRRPNVTGTVRGPTGIISAFNWINVTKKNAWGGFDYLQNVSGRATNASGNFGFYLEPGTYRFEAQPDPNARGTRTVSADCVVVTGQDKTCDFNLSSANVKLKVVDGSGNILSGSSAWTYLAEYNPSITKNWDWINFDLLGLGSASLENGSWNVQVNPPYNNPNVSQANFSLVLSGGNLTSVKNSAGETITAGADGVYTLVLPSVNLTGEITFSGARISHWAEVMVKRQDGDYFHEINRRGTGNGLFGFKVDPGIYRLEVRPYTGDSSRATSRSAICEVAATGTKTCNVALQVPNFLASVKTASGSTFNDIHVNLYTEGPKGDIWEYWLETSQGRMSAYLENGVYRLNIQPHWQHRALYNEQNYKVTVANGVVTSVINKFTNGPVIKVDDRYPLILAAPAVSGKVLMPTGTDAVPFVQVVPIDEQGIERWEYSTQTDQDGKFGLTLPNGNWNLWARTWGTGRTFTNSAKTPIVITEGALATPGEVMIRMRAPNIFGKVVKPGTTDPISEVNINIYMNGEYHYAWTDASGEFGAYIEREIPGSCGGACSIYLSTWKSTEYTSKRYEFTALGNLENLAMGSVSALVTVNVPSGSSTTPNKWGYVAVEEFDGTNYIWQPGMHTNELGQVGLSLTETKKYRLTAYPTWEREGDFSPKSTIIESFAIPSGQTRAQISITLDSPNLTFSVKDRVGNVNSWGWYEILRLNTTPDPDVYEPYRYGRLDQQGKGAQNLPIGIYKIRFWPSEKAIGIEKVIDVVVEQASVKIDDVVSSTVSITLPQGNVSGKVTRSEVGVAGATVAAVATNDATIIVSSVTLDDGSYELSLDMSLAWTVKALDPISTATGQISLAAVGGGSKSTLLTNNNISLAVSP